MRIAFIDLDNLRNPFWGAGEARATREVGKRLAVNHEVTVYCSKYPGWQDYIEEGMSYVHIGIESRFPRLTNLFFVLTVPFIIRKIKADMIIECFSAPFSVTFAPLFTQTPVIGLPCMFNASEFSRKYHLPFHWVEAIGCKFYKYFLPYSEVGLNKMLAYNPNIHYKVIQQGVGDEYFQIERRKPKHILFLGRFDVAQKGIDLLVEAYAKVSDKISLPLVIAGHGPDEKQIAEKISKLGVNGKVKMVGSAYGKKKFKLMSEALFVAFPSRHDEICLWSLEALAGGLPTVAFDLPESKWMPGKAVLKVKPFDVEAFSKAMVKLSSNDELVHKMGDHARKIASGYTWDKIAGEFESFFEFVIQTSIQESRKSILLKA